MEKLLFVHKRSRVSLNPCSMLETVVYLTTAGLSSRIPLIFVRQLQSGDYSSLGETPAQATSETIQIEFHADCL